MFNQFIILHTKEWFDKQIIAGKCVAKCLKTFKKMTEDKTTNLNLLDIQTNCLEIMKEFNCDPTFLNYGSPPFPGAVCLSVNKQLVHGIPVDYALKEGDVVTLDLGATYHGNDNTISAIADAAVTTIYGEPKDKRHQEIINLCTKALNNAIRAIQLDKQLGTIGNEIYKTVKNSGYHLIINYGGHGLSDYPHVQPFVANKQKYNEGIRFQNGLALAIEPMLSMNSAKTTTLDDAWTVVTNGTNCHVEHSVSIFDNKVHIMTDWENYDS